MLELKPGMIITEKPDSECTLEQLARKKRATSRLRALADERAIKSAEASLRAQLDIYDRREERLRENPDTEKTYYAPK